MQVLQLTLAAGTVGRGPSLSLTVGYPCKTLPDELLLGLSQITLRPVLICRALKQLIAN